MLRCHFLSAACAVAIACAAAAGAEPPVSITKIAPETTYVLVNGDNWNKTIEAWGTTGLAGLMKTDAMKKIFGTEGAEGNINKRMKEIGAPENSVSWPDAFGAAFYTSHDAELDTEQAQILFYGDWGARAEATSQMVDAVLADAVKNDKWKVDVGEEIAGRKVMMITLPEDQQDKALRERIGGQFQVQVTRQTEKLFYMRDGTRFMVCTERGGLREALEAVDGARTSKVTQRKDYQAAADQLGEQDVSVVLLMEPMQKASDAGGPWSQAQPFIQPLIGDVQAVTFGIDVAGKRGQAELTATVLMQGKPGSAWSLIGPSTPIEKPPPMVGPEAITYGRVNVQFKEVLPLVQTMAAYMPSDATAEIDTMLLTFGEILAKGFEAMGPGVWLTTQVRQPLNAESLVSTTLIACSNPKAVVPILAQFGPEVGLQPRDVDGNTIFGDDNAPFSIGVSNGYLAYGDPRQVASAMRAVGKTDLPSVADNPAYKRSASAAGSDSYIGWGYSDLIARWDYDRQMMLQSAKKDAQMGELMGRTDDSPWAKRLGYKLPNNTLESLSTLEPATVAKFVGPAVWTVKQVDKGLIAKYWLLPGSGE